MGMRLRYFIRHHRSYLLIASSITLLTMALVYAMTYIILPQDDTTNGIILQQSADRSLQQAVAELETQREQARQLARNDQLLDQARLRQVDNIRETATTFAIINDIATALVVNTEAALVAGARQATADDGNPITYVDVTRIGQAQAALQPILAGEMQQRALLTTVDEMPHVLIAVPLQRDATIFGALLVGQPLADFIQVVRPSGLSSIVFYGLDGVARRANFALNDETSASLQLSDRQVERILTEDTALSGTTEISLTDFQAIYIPVTLADERPPFAIMGVLVADNTSFIAGVRRHALALLVALVSGGIIASIFASLNYFITSMSSVPVATVPANSKAVADGDDDDNDQLHTLLRRQRRERNHLLTALESFAQGLLIMDRHKRIIYINATARRLLGDPQDVQASIKGLDDSIVDVLGAKILTGIYKLGQPYHLVRKGRILAVEAAAVMSPGGQRIGLILLIQHANRPDSQKTIVNARAHDADAPDLDATDLAPETPMSDALASDLSRQVLALQKFIVDTRQILDYDRATVEKRQRLLAAETLMLAVANDWRQIAQAADLQLLLQFDVKGEYIKGDENRLRWAIGNMVDNAIKYTPDGGSLTLEIKEVKDGMLHMRVRDSGVGIADADIKHVLDPYYRGTPRTASGDIVYMPGVGQGLPLAHKVITAHGGLMKVKSRVGVGTAIYFALPLAQTDDHPLPTFDEDEMEGATIMIDDSHP